MHTLYTTTAFVLGSTPQGENNRVYRLFTKDLGYLYAHGQGVRELRNRNRFALVTGGECRVTLVRGRESWRIASAQESIMEGGRHDQDDSVRRAYQRKLHALCASLMPRETLFPEVYELLRASRSTFESCDTTQLRDVEAIYAARILRQLGYVAHPQKAWPDGALDATPATADMLAWAKQERRALLTVINRGIRSASV